MTTLALFPREQIVGVFRGFQEGGLEFHADLVLPYRSEFQSIPMHGQFVLVQLETPQEAVLGRITSFSSEGKLSTGTGEEFNIRAVRENRAVPEDLREQYLKYRVNIRVLGVVRNGTAQSLTFVPSHRRLPHVGSPVAFPSGQVLREIAGHTGVGASIGHFALGEYVYAAAGPDFRAEPWMQLQSMDVQVRFDVSSLVSRRTFILARAGFGKSNLNKLLFSRLYERTPTTLKGGGRQVPVGTVIFDPDGEYFWPDDKGRPGLCDVPALRDKLVVFTPRRSKSPFYQSFVAGGVKLDIRRLRPADVIAISLSPEKQDQQNVRKLRSLNDQRWQELVDLVHKHGNDTPLEDVRRLLQLDDRQDAETLAARANATAIVRMLHDPSSQLMDMLLAALAEGKICVIDVSQLRGGQALVLSGLILRRIFDRNQTEFTNAEPKTIPTIAVVEEAQAVLNERATSAEPYIAWVKEGRKYDLGAVLVTQQPGSIPHEILSQGDNWFIFHLLSAGDLANVRKANAHFSEDLLGALLNEPIPGQGVFWSSVGGTPYPVSLRVLSFESLYSPLDPTYCKPADATFAAELRRRFSSLLSVDLQAEPEAEDSTPVEDGNQVEVASTKDALRGVEERAITKLRDDAAAMARLRSEGMAWGSLKAYFLKVLPASLDDVDTLAYHLVRKAMNEIFGPQGEAWHTFKHPDRGTTFVKVGHT